MLRSLGSFFKIKGVFKIKTTYFIDDTFLGEHYTATFTELQYNAIRFAEDMANKSKLKSDKEYYRNINFNNEVAVLNILKTAGMFVTKQITQQ